MELARGPLQRVPSPIYPRGAFNRWKVDRGRRNGRDFYCSLGSLPFNLGSSDKLAPLSYIYLHFLFYVGAVHNWSVCRVQSQISKWDAGAREVLASSAFLGDCGTCCLFMQIGVANIARLGYSGECYGFLCDRNASSPTNLHATPVLCVMMEIRTHTKVELRTCSNITVHALVGLLMFSDS